MTTQYRTTENGTARNPQNPLHRLSATELDELGREFDDLHEQVRADLSDRDARYIRSMISMQRRLALLGRAELLAARWRVPWLIGAATLGLAKILENMEIGHNVLHGQWDWMNDPVINSRAWDWDTASTAEAWRHSHNYIHHTFTNILGRDKDLGYEIMRIDPTQKWHPIYVLQPFYNVLLMFLFEWGVAVHDLDFDAIRAGDKSLDQVRREVKGIAGKARTQVVKDYIAWPLISAVAIAAPGVWRDRGRKRGGRRALDMARTTFIRTVKANAAANVVRNVWAYAIIFCGHFPDQTYTFTEEEVEGETRGGWYVRQLTGAANIDGSPLFHVISGNLGYQVEHHLFPDMPSTRYGEIAPSVREICARYGLPYNTGPFGKQLGMVQRTILRLALPGGRPRPKPGAYRNPPASSCQ